MKLTEDQLYIQTFADKTLSFGCIIGKHKYYTDLNNRRMGATEPRDTYEDYYADGESGDKENTGNIDILVSYFTGNGIIQKKTCSTEIETIIGHPVTYSRLVYLSTKTLREIYQDKGFNTRLLKYEKLYNNLQRYFVHNIEELNKDVLTWSPETIEVVKNFLMFLQKPTNV